MTDDARSEERAIYAIIAIAVSPVLIGVLVQHRVFDGGATLSLAVVFLAVSGVVRLLRS